MRFASTSVFLLLAGLIPTAFALPVVTEVRKQTHDLRKVDARSELDSVEAFQARGLDLEIRGSSYGEPLLSRAGKGMPIEAFFVTLDEHKANPDPNFLAQAIKIGQGFIKEAKAAGVKDFQNMPSPIELKADRDSDKVGIVKHFKFQFKWVPPAGKEAVYHVTWNEESTPHEKDIFKGAEQTPASWDVAWDLMWYKYGTKNEKEEMLRDRYGRR
ncbi:hypothetical protein BT96DRAFT_949306 [Gymnopus androsaceus JB14]|uniref:Uncharacterized protein n=1 Tax=Gymnopus androsaceus JB14 TaxID=1447944 RepID=A0A6A4GKB8_9AGAR|nr:hypothetical protein BT96DRAFT_949306 [Gymnopus androsaceus JB14]